MSKTAYWKESWLQHRNVLIQLIDQIEDGHLDFKPWEEAMTLRDMVLHVAGSSNMFVNMVKTETMTPPTLPEVHTMDDLKQAVKLFTDQTAQAFDNITDEELALENESKIPSMQGKKELYLQGMYDHELHHKGQLFIYARLVGATDLPFFR
ncbi:DinB family protein [Terribacillus saccharophilus]|uniref:DinB family protein n=1 Tax=Terribacillus saccharophilus TaxID=361277 RepID=UPI002DCD9827|nr:DinB family protein [Terribacillus saccharophilus]